LERTCGKTETIEEKIWGSHEVGMIVVHDIDKVRLTPPIITHVKAIDVQFNLIRGRCESAIGGRIGRCEVFHWMIKCEILHNFTRCDILLYLSDEKIVFSRSNVSTLFVV
jgi:hypothetical protein